jgi:hypothetical protein
LEKSHAVYSTVITLTRQQSLKRRITLRLPGMLYRCLCAVILSCASEAILCGQGLLCGAGSVSGEITWEGEGRADALSVELISSGRMVDRVSVAPDGSFELDGVATGEYELTLADPNGTIVQRQFVSVHGHVEGVVFRPPAQGISPRRQSRYKKERAKRRSVTCARRSPYFRLTLRRTTISAYGTCNRAPTAKPLPSFRQP